MPVLAQTTATVTESQVNTTTSGNQQYPAVACDTSGNYIVVWESHEQDGDGYGIFAQRYTASGTASGTEFQVNTTTAHDQRFPKVAMAHDGRFGVVWQSYDEGDRTWDIHFQAFDDDGSLISTEQVVNQTTDGQQRTPAIAVNLAGDYHIVWESEGDIYQRGYNRDASSMTSETLVNTTTTGSQINPDVAVGQDYTAVVVWQSHEQDGDHYGIFGQRYAYFMVASSTEFQVNTTTDGAQQQPSVAVDSLGQFAVAWESSDQDGDAGGIYLQAYTAAGVAAGGEQQVNTSFVGHQSRPAVGMSSRYSILVAWNSYGQDGGYDGVYRKTFDFDGSNAPVQSLGGEEIVNATTAQFQQAPAVATAGAYHAVVVWQDGMRETTASQDGDDFGIFQAVYIVDSPLPVELLSFEAEKHNDHDALLTWVSGYEAHFSHYELEHSRDAVVFDRIASVDASGSTSSTTDYAYVHLRPGSGGHYYRLRIVDEDGCYTYSDIRYVEWEVEMAVSILPNPTYGPLTLTYELPDARELTLTVVDALGRRVMVENLDGAAGANVQELSLEGLAQGVYFVTLTGDGVQESWRVVRR